jgi:hypothetical protein
MKKNNTNNEMGVSFKKLIFEREVQLGLAIWDSINT